MSTEGRARSLAVLRLIRRNVARGNFLDWIRIGQLLEYEHRSDRQQRAIAILADDAQKIGIRDAMRLIDLSLVMTCDELFLGRSTGGSRSADQNGVRIRGNELQYLACDRCVA